MKKITKTLFIFCVLQQLGSTTAQFEPCTPQVKEMVDSNNGIIRKSLQKFESMKSLLVLTNENDTLNKLSKFAHSFRTVETENANVEITAVVFVVYDFRLNNDFSKSLIIKCAAAVLIAKFKSGDCAVHKVMLLHIDAVTKALNQISNLMRLNSFKNRPHNYETTVGPWEFMPPDRRISKSILVAVNSKLQDTVTGCDVAIVAISDEDTGKNVHFCVCTFSSNGRKYSAAAIIFEGNNKKVIVELSEAFDASTEVETAAEKEVNSLVTPLPFVFEPCSELVKSMVDTNRKIVLASLVGFKPMQSRLGTASTKLSDFAHSFRILETSNKDVELTAIVFSARHLSLNCPIPDRFDTKWATAVLIAKYKCGNFVVHRVMNFHGHAITKARDETESLLELDSFQNIFKNETMLLGCWNFHQGTNTVASTASEPVISSLQEKFGICESGVEIVASSSERSNRNVHFYLCKFAQAGITYYASAVSFLDKNKTVVEFSEKFDATTKTVEDLVEEEVNSLTLPLPFVEWDNQKEGINFNEIEKAVKEHLILKHVFDHEQLITLERTGYGSLESKLEPSSQRLTTHIVTYCWKGTPDRFIYAAILYINGKKGVVPLVQNFVAPKDSLWKICSEADKTYYKFAPWLKITKQAVSDTSCKETLSLNSIITKEYNIHTKDSKLVDHIYRTVLDTRQFPELAQYKSKLLTIDICKIPLPAKAGHSTTYNYCALVYQLNVDNPKVGYLYARNLETLICNSLRNFYKHEATQKNTQLSWSESLPMLKKLTVAVHTWSLDANTQLLNNFEDTLVRRFGHNVKKFKMAISGFGQRQIDDAEYVTLRLTSGEEIKFIAIEMTHEINICLGLYRTQELAEDFANLQFQSLSKLQFVLF